MILHDNRPPLPLRQRLWPWLLGGLCLLLLAFAWMRYRSWEKGQLYCDAESVVQKDGKPLFQGKNALFLNGQSQTAEEAHSGKYSSKVWKQNEYGMGIHFEDVKPGEVFEVSVWRKSDQKWGQIVVAGDWGMDKIMTGSGKSRPGSWEELTLSVTVPAWVEKGTLRIFAFNNNETPAYFDDLSISRRTSSSTHSFPDFTDEQMPEINLILGEKEMNKILALREEAIKAGVLSTGEDDWVETKLETGEGPLKGKVRLKGDWTDHLTGDKWSFRIQLDDGMAWKRMVTFSLHNPDTRHHLDEWVYHQWLSSEDVLTTRYGFVQLKLNGKNLGIYAYEEHFSKELLEYRHRREGPILKFNEEGFWEFQEEQFNTGLHAEARSGFAESGTVDAFGMKAVLADTQKFAQFRIGQNLLWKFKNRDADPMKVFDADKMAKFLAIAEVCQAQHGLIWHNLRFYYNPITSKLEPIGFDGYTHEGPFNFIRRPFLAHSRHIEYISQDFSEMILEPLMLNPEFLDLYVGYLNKFTEDAYLNSLFKGLMPGVQKWESLLTQEYKGYWYDPQLLYNTAREIHLVLKPRKEGSVKTWQQNDGLHLENYHCLPVWIQGWGMNDRQMSDSLDQPVYLPAFGGALPAEYTDIQTGSKPTHVFFTTPGFDTLFSAAVYPWEAPSAALPPLPESDKIVPEPGPLYTLREKVIWFKPGDFQINSDILIPEGYTVMLPPGLTLNFMNGAGLISRSPIIAKGESEYPIRFRTNDRSGTGLTVLDPEGKSILRYCSFDGFRAPRRAGWELTGAVNFYEAEVSFTHCSFLNNQCEDGLNLVRCSFSMEYCLVSGTSGDGFDADFCEGTVRNSTFTHTTNDGMDFSGSVITLIDNFCEFNGDKGVSVGEESKVKISNLRVENSVTGFASKDLSIAELENITLKKVKMGFILYQKKPEYGPARMEVKYFKADAVDRIYSVQKNSQLTLDGEIIKGSI